ncbi:heme-binding domain-containing protein [Ulvibacterium sp.]|uniref:heme-binding domain-containing protein n=1 Tax=Ulvibacterium sp. TaxID=2665914 RepID=UPI002601934E|nr:heme-binding domain-containing protein [Ulvibacterium sp.]
MKTLKKISLVLLVIFVAMQFYRPEKNLAQGHHTGIFLSETNPGSELEIVLQESCYDCHSNHTEYPWYNNVAPVSFWLAYHVEDGKKHLNFSEWDSYSVKKKDHKLDEVIEMIENAEMPLKEYTWTHENARLTKEQCEALIAWAKKTRSLYQLNEIPQ